MKTEQVEMTAQERAEFEEFKKYQEQKKAEAKAKEDRKAYKDLVDETINSSLPILQELSEDIKTIKTKVYENFSDILEMKSELFKVKDGQKTNTFTNSEGNKRIMLGYHVTDDYRDTVNEGVAKVKEYIESLSRDKESAALVNAVLQLLSKDQKGNLKASRVLQLRKMAVESGNASFLEGVTIIEESYQPAMSKQFIRAEIKDEKGAWVSVPLGITEA